MGIRFFERFLRAFYFPPYEPALLKVENFFIGLPLPSKHVIQNLHPLGN